MADHASAKKAAKQAIRRTLRNQRVRSEFRTRIKKFRAALAVKYDGQEAAEKTLAPLFGEVQSVLMRAASRGIIKGRNASRHISRLGAAFHRVIAT